MSSPAPTSNTIEIAISPTTRRLRRRRREPPSPPSPCAFLPPALSVELRSTRAARTAGARPKRMPVRIDTANVNARTRPSRPIASSRGMLPGLIARIAPRASAATSSPATPPMRPSSAVSVRSWRTSRCQRAPSATRTAISFWRAVARVSNRFATLAHAMSRTSVTEPITTNTARRTLPTTDSTSGTTSIVKVRSRLSFSRIRAAMAATSACACAIVTPGFSRAMRL